MKAMFASVAVLLVFAANGAAAKPSSLSLGDSWFGQTQLQQPVEQQTPGWSLPCPDGYVGDCHDDQSLWVTNPTSCLWDVDDNGHLDTSGDLAAGASVSLTICVIEDWRLHRLSFGANAHTDSLVVTVCYGQTCDTLAPYPVNGNTTGYSSGCFWSAYRGLPLPVVAGSNGGVGVPVNATFTIHNPTARKARDVSASFRAGNFIPC